MLVEAYSGTSLRVGLGELLMGPAIIFPTTCSCTPLGKE